MIRNITFGQYYACESPIHRLDPRVKIVATFVYMIVIFFVKDLIGYGLVTAALSAVIAAAEVPLRFIVRGLRPIAVILVLTFILNLLLYDGTILWKYGIFKITYEGLKQASYISVRLIILIFGASLLTYTTKPLALTDGFEALMRPLNRLGVPSHEIAMMMSIALRFIPTLMTETDKIMKAQQARGADFESGNLMRRAKNMIPLLVPLFIRAFVIAQELAIAMEARCYRGGDGRTKLHPMKYEKKDFIAYAVLVIFVAAVFIQSRGWLPIPMIWRI
ncbi:MAG: energy-coupling factor transporter transmembrane component T family protein [Anaerovoracaceae bacterium]